MRLQKQLTRQIGKKKYFCWVVNISPKIIEQIGWKAGLELDTVFMIRGKQKGLFIKEGLK